METLPQDITLKILSGLPAESVFECKRVCKTWRTLLRHVKGKTKVMGILSFGFDGPQTTSKGRLYYGELVQTDDENIDRRCELVQTTDENVNIDRQCSYRIPSRLDHPTINNNLNGGRDPMVGSHNGLVCFTKYHRGIHDPIYICNPFTKEYCCLQRLICQGGRTVNGFGYHHSANEYKVVRIYYPNHDSAGQVEVCTLGSESEWTSKGEITYSLRSESPGILANGSLHWLDDKEWNIVAFDLADEEFRLLPSPPCFHTGKLTSSYQLQVLGGYLSVVHQERGDRVDIWSLKKKNIDGSYDMKEQEYHSWSWSREFSIAWEGSVDNGSYEPFALTKSNEVLLWYDTTILSCYNPKTATIEKIVNISTGFRFFQAIPHIKSLISLKELGEESTIRIYRVKRFSDSQD